jgi:hypothetical protein
MPLVLESPSIGKAEDKLGIGSGPSMRLQSEPSRYKRVECRRSRCKERVPIGASTLDAVKEATTRKYSETI